MKIALIYLALILPSAAQIAPAGASYNPQIYLNVDSSGTVHLVCNNLTTLPSLSTLDCTGTIDISSAALGVEIYFGVLNNQIHVGSAYSFLANCTNCYQDFSLSPQVGEYQIANYIVGQSNAQYLFSGVPSFPPVVVLGCASYSIVYFPSQVLVSCGGTN